MWHHGFSNSFRSLEHDDQSTSIPIVLTELQNGPVRLHGPKFVQRSVPDAIATHDDPQELCRAPLMLRDC